MYRRSTPIPLATVAMALAGILVWQSVAALLDRDAAASEFRLVEWLQPSSARGVVTGVALLGLLAAGLLIVPRTRFLGAAMAASGLLAITVYLVVVWSQGRPVQCLCSTSTAPRGSFAHLEAIIVVLACALLSAFVGRESRHDLERSPMDETTRGP